MSSLTIKTNNHPREILCWGELTTSEKRKFGYQDVADLCGGSYFRYKGQVYSFDEFFSTNEIKGWDAYASETYFSGLVVKLVEGDFESQVIVGRYAS